ncbi:MAG: hypothetical protein ACI8W8_002455 [Rhodothermales bacterium]|jgi:hypothetical protein
MTCILFAILALSLCAEDKPKPIPDRYELRFANGDIVHHHEIRDWHEPKKQPRVDKRALFDAKNPVVMLRDRTLSSHLQAPFVALANGDVLPGRVIGANSADPSSPWPAHFVVVPRPPLSAFIRGDARVRIHQDRVTRIVFREFTDRLLAPGDVRFADGRVVRVKSVRWRESGLRALSVDGVVTATWSELAEIRLPAPDIQAAVLDDLRPPTDPARHPRIARIQTIGGATLSFWQDLLERDKDQRGEYCHTLQPSWAVSAIRVPLNRIVTRSYRPANAIPLSSLPSTALVQRSLTGYLWPWTRNRNVRGGMLACAAEIADFGIGTHSYSEIAFDLPPFATHLRGSVGLDRVVGNGGCCELRILRDKPGGKPLWQSGVRTGNDDPQRFDIGIAGVKRVILQTDAADKKAPKGADPLDIRDEASWLRPVVIADSAKTRVPLDLPRLIPALDDWNLAAPSIDKIGFCQIFEERVGAWQNVLVLPHGASNKDVVMRLERELRVSMRNAYLAIRVGRDDNNLNGHSIILHVNGEPLKSPQGSLSNNHGKGHIERRSFSLGHLIGQTVKLELLFIPTKNGETAGLVISEISHSPLVAGLTRGKPIKPDLPLAPISPAEVHLTGGGELANGEITLGSKKKPLAFLGLPYSDGYGIRGGSRIIYNLHPSWLRFVAIGGLVEGWQDIHYELHLDSEEKPFWTSPKLGRGKPGMQIDVAIPPGHRRISLSVRGRGDECGSFIHAGFVTDGTPYTPVVPLVSPLLGASITASSSRGVAEDGESPPSAIIDGDPATRWSSNFEDNQQLILEFAEPKPIKAVILLWEVAAPKRYTIAVSDERKTWHQVYEQKDGIQGPRSDRIRIDPVTARFLKIDLQQRATEYGFSLYELQIE